MSMAMDSKKIILFDIDGVLVNDKGLGKSCFDKVVKQFNRVWKIDPNYVFDGRTDFQIINDLIKMNQGKITKDLIFKGLEEYYTQIKNNIHSFDIEALPGAINLINHLKKQCKIGVLSGNLKKVAHLKLKHCGFNTKEIKFSYFGDQAENRNSIFADVVNSFGPEIKQLLIVGDTPIDIKGAKNAMLKIVAVASGSYNVEQLSDFDPDWTLPDLNDIQRFEKILSYL